MGRWTEPLKKYRDFVAKNPKATPDEIAECTGLSRYEVENLSELAEQNGGKVLYHGTNY